MLGLIVYGRRNTEKVVAQGTFACPGCGAGRMFVHKRVRRWFTLYFIPVIPLGTASEYVECWNCSGTFKPEVLASAVQQ
jgi:hypothetical protein